jgi:hypothetical protein
MLRVVAPYMVALVSVKIWPILLIPNRQKM